MASLADGGLALLLIVAVGMLPGSGEGVGRTKLLAFFFLLFWYDPLFTSRWCTLGQWLAGIRVRRNDDFDEPLPLHKAILRFLVKGTLGWVSFFSMPFTDRYRALHDIAAGSVVLQVRAIRAAV